MKILITGGSGFIGQHLISVLLESSKNQILNIDLNPSNIVDPKLKSVELDICSSNLCEVIPKERFDVCIHLAAKCKEPGYTWEEYFFTNHIGSINTLALCEFLEIKKILFTSTMMVYQAGEFMRTEQSITAPDTAYGISKLLAEKEFLAWRTINLNHSLKIIRPAVVFGKNENANFTILYKTLKMGFFPFIGKDTTIKSSIYVHELTEFISFLLNNPTRENVFNFAFPDSYTIRKITDVFMEVFDLKVIRPTLSFGLMLSVARFCQILNSIGFKNSIHPRRIEKLYYSTNILPKSALDCGYRFIYDLRSALVHWKNSEDSNIK